MFLPCPILTSILTHWTGFVYTRSFWAVLSATSPSRWRCVKAPDRITRNLNSSNLVPTPRAFSAGGDRTPDALDEIKNRNQYVRMRSSSLTAFVANAVAPSDFFKNCQFFGADQKDCCLGKKTVLADRTRSP